MADNHMIIKLRRSKLDINNSANESKINAEQLEFGEAMYLDTNKYLIFGDGDDTSNIQNTDLRRFKAFDKNIVDLQVFCGKTDNTILEKEDGTVINPKTKAANVSITYQTKASDVNTVINDLDSRITTNKSNITNNANAITALQTRLTTDEGNITTNANDIKALQTRMGTAETNISSLQTQTNVANLNNTALYVTGIRYDTSSGSKTSNQLYYNSGITITTNNVLKGAAWNDFAEFRQCNDKAGYVVVEKGDGSLIRSHKRLLPGASIVSDTYGMVIGKEEDGYSPVAVAGRVLAYATDKEHMKAGDPLCTGCNGTVSKMSRLETILYPDRIIGYVSEIPSYALWNDVLVNGRIWVKVK